MRFLLILVILAAGCAAPKVIKIQVTNSDSIERVQLLREFSAADYKKAQKALDLLSHVAPELSFTNKVKLSWIRSDKFAGITIIEGNKEILIDQEFEVKRGTKIEYFNLARVLGHEMAHFEWDMKEPEVQIKVDRRLFLIFIKDQQRIYSWNP